VRVQLDRSPFDAAPLIAFPATKESNYALHGSRQRSDVVTLAHIKEQSRLSLGTNGRPRMTEERKEVGLDVGHRRVGRLMRQNGISVVRTLKHKVTTIDRQAIAKQSAERGTATTSLPSPQTCWIVTSKTDQPNQKWAGDISYAWTREGWLNLAVLLDLHSRRVIGWTVSNRMKRDLVIRALNMAIAFRTPPKAGIHHTDRCATTVLTTIRRSSANMASKSR
jgi:transposase InsO family protein